MTPAELRKILKAMTPGPWEATRRDGFSHSAIEQALESESWPFTITMPSPPFVLGSTGAAVAASLGADGKRTAKGDAAASANATGIATLRNAAEVLVELWEAAEAYETDTALLERDADMVHVAISRGTERRLHAALVRLKEVKP